MQPEPAVGDGEVEAGLVLGGAAAFPEEGRVDLLDVKAAVLNRLDRAGDLQEPWAAFSGSANGRSEAYFITGAQPFQSLENGTAWPSRSCQFGTMLTAPGAPHSVQSRLGPMRDHG
jgi:hypothetical protein